MISAETNGHCGFRTKAWVIFGSPICTTQDAGGSPCEFPTCSGSNCIKAMVERGAIDRTEAAIALKLERNNLPS